MRGTGNSGVEHTLILARSDAVVIDLYARSVHQPLTDSFGLIFGLARSADRGQGGGSMQPVRRISRCGSRHAPATRSRKASRRPPWRWSSLPLTGLAGPDGRRLTLGDNRASLEAAPSHTIPLDQKITSPRPANETTMPVPVPPAVVAEAPVIRVVPPKEATATPAFKPEPKAATPSARIDRVRHEPDRKAKVSVKTVF